VDLHHIRDLLAQAVVLVVILFCFTLRLAQVSGVSMEPTVPANSYVLVGTLDYRLLSPRAGDVIAFAHDRVGPETFIKRVVATPGERVAEVNGTMVVNGVPLREKGRRIFDRRSTREVLVPEQQYYAVGDNRPKSDDSRNWGAVSRSSVRGRVDAVIWPLGQMRVVR
jgi:signal peptidase I